MRPESASHISISDMTLIALMCAVLCILCPFAVPFGPVPVTLGVFVVFLAAYMLGPLRGMFACLLYLLLGALGLPVFSGYTGGIGKLLGPTGGYMAGYIVLVLMTGWSIQRSERSATPDSVSSDQTTPVRIRHLLLQLAGHILGLLLCYLLGTAWFTVYKSSDGMTFLQALSVCVLPFLPFDALKIAASLVIGNTVRSALKRARQI